MKKLFILGALTIAGIFWAQHGNAQVTNLKPVAQNVFSAKNSGINFKTTTPFVVNQTPSFKKQATSFAKDITYTKLNIADIKLLHQQRNAGISLTFPYKNENITLDLVQVNIFAEGFQVLAGEGDGVPVDYTPGVYYQGTINNDPNSIAAISIFENEIMGIVSTTNMGNINIGKYGKGAIDEYMIYSDRDILVENTNAGCATPDDPDYLDEFHQIMNNEGGSRIASCPKIYFEADYQLYQNKGSVTNTTNYVTGIYNNSAVIYTNESVPTQISTIFVWTSADGYASGSSYDALNSFKAFRTSFTGDIAHLVALDPGGLGGVAATINGLCNSNKYCYSDIDATYNDFPTYSWTVMVVTHEMGHLFGSYHTHNCSAWVGGAIDNCYTTEGGCPSGPAPIDGGTIMSYCHLTGYGINFVNGFGTQPGNAIRNTISAAGCVTSCAGEVPYCASTGLSTADEWIQTISVNGTTNASGNNGGYADFTATTINLIPGEFATFTLTPGYTGTVYPEYFSIWVDYNNDNDFNDLGENVFNSVAVTSAISSSFFVLPSATGTTRMRITMKYNALATPCETFDYGEVEDYTVAFVPELPYCNSNGINATSKYIDYVKLGTINRTSGNDGGYYDGTALTTNLMQGATYTLTYSAGFSGTIYQMYWKTWIDYNADGDFDDVGEQLFQKRATTSGNLKKKFIVPMSATPGETRLRISAKYGALPGTCESFAEGEVEDYTVNILPALFNDASLTFNVNVYPNPSQGLYNIEYLNAGDADVSFEVYDITGNIIRKSFIEGNNGFIMLDITDVANGLYFVKIASADGSSIVKQIVKQ